MRNNNIDGRKNKESISGLLQDHPTLTCIDLGNSEVIQNRNRLYEEGFSAVVEGIVKSQNSLISEINLEQSCLTGEGLYALCYLAGLDLQILNLANNDLGNEACQHIRHVLPTIVDLNLSNTKMGLRGCLELAKGIEENSPRL